MAGYLPRSGAVDFGDSHRSWLEPWLSMFAPERPAKGVCVWERNTGRELARISHATLFEYFPDGRSLAVSGEKTSSIEIWDIPPCHPWYVEHGLPVAFLLLLLLGGWLIARARRLPKAAAVAPC